MFVLNGGPQRVNFGHLCSTLPSVETPYPLLVLCGPQGAGKKDLALKLVDEFPDYFGYGFVMSLEISRKD